MNVLVMNKLSYVKPCLYSSFDTRCNIVRNTAITPSMSYEERFRLQMLRYGV